MFGGSCSGGDVLMAHPSLNGPVHDSEKAWRQDKVHVCACNPVFKCNKKKNQ